MDTPTALAVELAADINTSGTIQVVGTALLFYDYLLTLNDEIRCVWKRRFSGVTVTFLALRYGTLLCTVCGAARIPSSGPANDYTCSVLGMLFFVAQAITFAGLSLFCYLRVYAITDKNKTLSVLVGVSMTVFFFLELFESIPESHAYTYPLPYHGCSSVPRFSALKTNLTIGKFIANVPYIPILDYFLGYIGTAFGLTGELIVQLATWKTTLTMIRSLRRLKMTHRLSTLLLRDGTFMFSFLLFWLVTSELVFKQRLTELNTTAISILVCRFILRLRQVYLPADASSETYSFMAGNMGAPLHFDVKDDDPYDLSDDESDEDVILISGRPLETNI